MEQFYERHGTLRQQRTFPLRKLLSIHEWWFIKSIGSILSSKTGCLNQSHSYIK